MWCICAAKMVSISRFLFKLLRKHHFDKDGRHDLGNWVKSFPFQVIAQTSFDKDGCHDLGNWVKVTHLRT